MKTCREIGTSLSEEEIRNLEAEHLKMLSENNPEEFYISIMRQSQS